MRGHIRKRGKQSWAVVLERERDGSGKRCQKWHSIKGTRKDAELELAKLLGSVVTGDYIEPAKMKVGDFLGKWLNDCARFNVGGKTFERYAEIVRNHLAPTFGTLRLTKLTPLHIQAHYSQARQNGRKDGRGGLSAQTVLHHHRVLHRALQLAVKWRILSRNPADAVEPPRPEYKEVRVIDEMQSVWLIEAAAGTRLHVPIVLAVCTGMRRGEILALKWDDVDLDLGFLSVRRALEQTREAVVFKEPKSRHGRRAISLPPLAIDFLRAHRTKQESLKDLLGCAYQDNGLVCCCDDGRIWKPSAFTSAYCSLLRRRRIANVPFHALRHSHASQLLRAGVSPKLISERLGHSKVGFTLDVYAHLLPGMQEEAAHLIDAGLRAAMGKAHAPVM